MAAPDRAFNEVKSILRKLDRDIQSARDRRLGREPIEEQTPGRSGGDAGESGGLIGNADRPTDATRSATPGRDATNDGGRHGFGRARPKRPASPGNEG